MNPENISREEIKKLLGGYATGTLTAAEMQVLFAAALDDQALFDELAREQSLRDLLRDPAVRGELLSTLDTAGSRSKGFWQWLSRPMVAGLATASVVAIATVAVWQAAPGPAKRDRMVIAELKPAEQAPPFRVPAPTAPPAMQRAATVSEKGAATLSDKQLLPAAPAVAVNSPDNGIRVATGRPLGGHIPASTPPSGSPEPSAVVAEKGLEKQLALAAETAATARRADAEVRKVETNAIAAPLSRQNSPLDARALFYLNQPVPVANAFVDGGRGGGARPALSNLGGALTGHVTDASGASILNATVTVADPAKQITFTQKTNASGDFSVAGLPPGDYSVAVEAPGFKKLSRAGVTLSLNGERSVGNLVMDVGAAAESVEVTAAAPTVQTAPRSVTRSLAKTMSVMRPPAAPAPAARLGVRVSILRGDREVDVGTVLESGEKVRLKLIPNNDGFLYVAEGTRTIASGTAQRLKPFETPELRFEGSGRRQLVVTFSRTAIAAEPGTAGTLSQGNIVEPAADQGRATYVVAGALDTAPGRVVVPVTLNYK